MKKSELRKLIAEYKKIKLKSRKSQDKKLYGKMSQIEQRYYHETGRILKDKLENTSENISEIKEEEK